MDDMDSFVEGKEAISVTSMCTVFAESEIISLLAENVDPGDIALGMIHSICRRTAYFARKLNPSGKIFFSGGLARYQCFQKILEQYLEIPVEVNLLSQYVGAIGAALL